MNHTLLSTMHVVQLDQPNGNLTFREIPMPRPKGDQVLIRMAAVGALVATTSRVTVAAATSTTVLAYL